MLNLKNAALSMAVVMALAACGGSDDPVTTPPTSPGAENPQQPGGEQPGAEDAMFTGDMTLSANQVLFNEVAQSYADFTSTGVYGQARGTVAPIDSFGLRLSPNANMTAEGAQSETVRVAFEMEEQEGGSGRLIQLLIDQATLSVSEDGALSVTVPDTASAYVVVRNADGETATATATGLPADVIRILPIADDPTSSAFVVDVDAAMEAALAGAEAADAAVIESAQSVEGRFDLRMTTSGITLLSPDGTALTGATITVDDQPAVSGGGVAGILRVGE